MRLGVATYLAVGLAGASASAAPSPTVHLDLTVPDVALIAQTLGQIQCATVAQFEVCRHAVELLRTIREQAQKQVR